LEKSDNANDNIETPRLIQRQRQIIRSEDITAAESTTENAAIDRKSDTTTEDQAAVY
jgi:hypothetical protein